jgi:F420H(2)-dependent quinone reductase
MPASDSSRRSGSAVWTGTFRLLFRGSPDGMTRTIRRVAGFGPVEEFIIVGRTSGQERHKFLSLLEVGGAWYVGHPNGRRSHWVRNLEAAGSATIVRRDGTRTRVKATLLPDGPERDAAVTASGRQQPFPVSLAYRGARGHINQVGEYFRLDLEP